MRSLPFLMIATLLLSGNPKESVLRPIDSTGWDSLLSGMDDRLYVVNFWATWCKPCVAELPHFMAVNTSYSDSEFKMILVSLDDPEALDKAIPDMRDMLGLDVDIYLLDDPTRMDPWINSVDSSWSGSIPATVFYRNGKPLDFHEGSLSEHELKERINRIL